jgi:hypothetical protein
MREVLVGLLLTGLDVGVLGALGFALGDLGLELLVATGELELALLLDGVALGEHSASRLGRSAWRFSSSTQVTRLAAK